MVSKRKRICVSFLYVLACAIAVAILDYPFIARYFNSIQSETAAQEYLDLGADVGEIDTLWERAQSYNDSLLNGVYTVTDAFRGSWDLSDSDYQSQLSLGSSDQGVMAVLRIPEIDVTLPVYHGCSQEVLQKGVGHVPSTSLPTGGKSRHTVLAGHRGLQDKTLFTDLDYLEEGDVIYLDVLDKTLAYRVTEKEIVLPHEVEVLDIVPGLDLLTLVTCHPYGQDTHRLLIHAERMADVSSMTASLGQTVYRSKFIRSWWKYITVGMVLWTVIMLYWYNRRAHRA